MSEIDTKAVEVGSRYNAAALSAQKGYTRGTAAAEASELIAEKLLSPGFLDALDAAEKQVLDGMADQANALLEARGKTQEQGALLRKVKTGVRRLDRCATNALEGKSDLDEYRGFSIKTISVSKLCVSARNKLAAAKRFAAAFDANGAPAEFVANLDSDVGKLAKSDGDQENALKDLTAKQRAFCEAKGQLYFLIKRINNAGQALHAGDLEAAARYNLNILYRSGRRAAAGAEEATPVAK